MNYTFAIPLVRDRALWVGWAKNRLKRATLTKSSAHAGLEAASGYRVTGRGGFVVVEHRAWVGSDYISGINGHRTAIVGYSHWLGHGDKDRAEVTQDCVSKVISGEFRTLFFTAIRNYFDYERHEDFWRRVIFFNYLPNSVGGPSQRFGAGTEDQVSLAKARFLRLIRENLPRKVFIFTSRHRAFPETGIPLQNLGQNFPAKFRYRQYEVGSHDATTAFFLRHPQGAKKELMQRAVRHIMGRSNIDDEEE